MRRIIRWFVGSTDASTMEILERVDVEEVVVVEMPCD